MAICCGAAHDRVIVVLTMRRMRLTARGAGRRAILTTLACLILIGLMWCTSADDGASDTCTAPPPRTAPPAAQAASFANAIRTDMSFALVALPKPP